ncbi:MAG: DGQHR domain-containing protein [Calothrix sp. FI2-JRJ7]|jgi:DNA sulfur modification protein DndB|nr:DGQHR domain-containing protein [Calothrix sp. FI2-JRJ7]
MADYVPALKAKMGDWDYYVTVMKLGKVARECRLAEEIHANKDLDELIQREIQDRVQKEMVPYLVNTPQRFYGAIVVAVYGGEPEFSAVKVQEHYLIDDNTDRSSYGFGLLRFDGSQIYYALDGQHRLKSIQEGIRQNPDLAKEEISVIILKHENTKEGLERTRRLFSTLNRRAKPTSSGMNIAIDEDDAVAIVSRRLIKENDTLKMLVLGNLGSKQISPKKVHDPYIATLTTFYETNEVLLGAYNGGLDIDAKFKQFRPTDTELDEFYDYLENIWMCWLDKCPGFDDVLRGRKKAGDIRKRMDNGALIFDDSGKPIAGGNVYARPIGQFILADVLKLVKLQNKSVEDAIEAIMTHVAVDIDQAPWVNVIWNPTKQRADSGKEGRGLIASMISHALGLRISTRIRDLKQKYRDTVEDFRASLLEPIDWSDRPISENVEDEEEDIGES